MAVAEARCTVEDIELELLVQALYLRYQYDFRGYARASLSRRVAQALRRLGCETTGELQQRLLREPALLPALLDQLTVGTTELFRNPGYFRCLRREVVPYLRTYPSLKVWVAGCSTGEEVYSLAILLHEEGLLDKTVLYATDINPASLEVARRGIYRADAVDKASGAYLASGGRTSLDEYYSAAYDAVRFDPELTRNVVFSDHSLATDAVFSEVHLVSCRNVMIYFSKTLQERAFGLFHEALVRQGFLGLGAKEALGTSGHGSSFEVVSREDRIYRRL